jgi:hypothetical protein
MNEGEAWYLNFNLYHSVENNGRDERVHLVIDCVGQRLVPEFLSLTRRRASTVQATIGVIR